MISALLNRKGEWHESILAIAVGGEHCPRYCYPKWLSRLLLDESL